MAGLTSTAGSDRGVPVPSLRMSLTLAHQSKIRSMYCSRQSLASQENGGSPASEMGSSNGHPSGPSGSINNLSSRPDSSSSATSSLTDWESGLSTVRRQPPPPVNSKTTGRNVEDISAFSESRLRVGAMTKAFEMHAGTMADARSRSRFKPPPPPPNGFAAGLKKLAHLSAAVMDEETASNKTTGAGSSARSGSVDTLDRLSVRSELPIKASQLPGSANAAGQQQQQRRRHRSVERRLDEDADTPVDGGADLDSSSVHINERFSAAVFHHSKPGKLMMATKAAAAASAVPTRTLHKSGRPVPPPVKMATHHPMDPMGQDPDSSNAIYSLRPCGESDLSVSSMAGSGGVQLSHGPSGSASRSIQDHIIATQMSRLNREMPISDVYHEYNMSLGLAPPLSELLVTSAAAVAASTSSAGPATGANSSIASSEDVFSSFDQISLADTVTELSDKADLASGMKSVTYTKRPPPRPSKIHSSTWGTPASYHHGGRQHHQATRMGGAFDASSPESVDMMTLRHGVLDMTRRDEADGRSMTDSNYSGYSPHRNLKLMPAGGAQPTTSSSSVAKEPGMTMGNKSNTIRAVAIIESDSHRAMNDTV